MKPGSGARASTRYSPASAVWPRSVSRSCSGASRAFCRATHSICFIQAISSRSPSCAHGAPGLPPDGRAVCRARALAANPLPRSWLTSSEKDAVMDKNARFHLWYAIAAFLGLLLIQYVIATTQKIAPIPYSQFQQLLREGKVAEIGVSDRFIQGKLKEPLPDGKSQFVTTRVDPEFAQELQKSGVTYTGQIESTFLRDLLSWVLPVLLFFGVWTYLARRMAAQGGLGGGLMSIGKSKAKVYVETDTGVKFDDVAGVDEAKDELREVVDFLKNPAEYGRLGGRMPKGVLLVGPPGTGKTLLAKAVAGEAKVPFFSISGSEFVEMFVGVGAARVRDLFQQAREKAAAIIFIDELDALGRARGMGPCAGGHDEKEQVLNQLLVELDGFDSRTGLVLLGATNRPEILDPALPARGPLRPAGSGGPPGQEGPHPNPPGPYARGQTRARRGRREGGSPHPRLHGRGPRQLGQRSGAAGHASQRGRG